MQNNKKISPHSLESEQIILGAILLDRSLIGKISKRINSDTFYEKIHKEIFNIMLDIYEECKPIDIIILCEALKNKNMLEVVGGRSYLTSLTTIVPSTSNIDYYLDLIIDKKNRRKCLIDLNRLEATIYNGKIDEIKTYVKAIDSIFKNDKSVEQLFMDASNIKRSKNSNCYISTGFKQLDDILSGGFKSTSLNIITGIPGSGKSTIINQILAGAIAEGKKSFLYSGELPEEDLMFWFNRTISNKYDIKEKKDKKGRKYIDITDHCWDKIGQWIKGKFKIYASNSKASKENILSTIEYLAINEDIKLFVLDNLMTFDIGDSEKQYQQQKQLCLELKALAKKYMLVIILVAHPKKIARGESASMYDVSGASEIVGSADSVIRLERIKRNDLKDESKVIILKNRWGGIINRAFEIYFDSHRKRFYTNQEELNRDYGYDLDRQSTQVVYK